MDKIERDELSGEDIGERGKFAVVEDIEKRLMEAMLMMEALEGGNLLMTALEIQVKLLMEVLEKEMELVVEICYAEVKLLIMPLVGCRHLASVF